MKLDRYTEKAQEAILAAQRLATDADSPTLDVEHLLAALLEDPEGIPAVTLRALGADPSAIALELAAVLSRRARIAGGQLSLDPRARRMLERAEEEAKRLNDDYVSTEHLLLAAAESRWRRGPHPDRGRCRPGAHPGRPPEGPGRPAGHLPEPRVDLSGAGQVRSRPDPGRACGQARPGHRSGRGDPARHPGAVPTDQEQPGAHR